MATAILTTELAQSLGTSLRGPIITPSDAEYEDARSLYNAMIDKRPAVIARCVDASDVMAAVNFAREQGLDLPSVD